MPSRREIHAALYVLGLAGLAFSTPLFVFVMSISQFFLLANWLIEGKLKEKFKTFFKNKPAWIFTLIYLMHLVGIFYSNDLHHAIDDLRIKIPLLALPIIISTSPKINRKSFHLILYAHILGTLFYSITSTYLFYKGNNTDIRDVFIYISHIRFSLNVCLDIFILFYLIFEKQIFPPWAKILFLFVAFWFIYCLFFLESFTGITILIISTIGLLFIYIFKKTKHISCVFFILFLIIIMAGVSLYLRNIYKDFSKREIIDKNKVEYLTKNGNPYLHDFDNKMTENGYYTWLYVSYEELEPAWNQRSTIKFDSLDYKGQPIKFTLIRFLTSKGLRKDQEGVNSLLKEEISLIEDGVANIGYVKKGGLEKRIKNVLWEYEHYKITHDPRGQSLMQRIELWQTSFRLIKKYFFTGVGTGDVKNVITAQMHLENSHLKDAGLHPHNQFITITLTFGVPGLLLFLFCLLYPPIKRKKISEYLFLSFFLIAMLSMFTEDTLETQAGVTFFTFFYCLFMFVDNKTQTNS
ncbi:MAG: O-antigen ligase family protein [Bacteroidales bacterium]|jgi:hypothetical protein|nr:O-antigen ligase family protein [Bacteroidales bacterium]MDD4214035.1 O-antigen ligase family protein [Bacteroidales bacterium]